MRINSTNLDSVKDWAAHYEGLGLKLLPIKQGTKRPEGKWKITEAGEFRSNQGIGVHLGQSKLCSLDVDHPECFEIISKALKWDDLSEYNGITGKGRRYVFRLPEGAQYTYKMLRWDGVPNKKTGEIGSKTVFELRVGEHQDCLPPTIHPDTKKPYAWDRELTEIPELPLWLQDIFKNWDDYETKLKELNPYEIQNSKTEPKEFPADVEFQVETLLNRAKAQSNTDIEPIEVINRFNKANRVESWLIKCGYDPKGKNKFISPYSTTVKEGGGWVQVHPEDNNCYIYSASDPLYSGEKKQPRSPFDFFAFKEHGCKPGDSMTKPIAAAARLLGVDYKSQRASVSDFSNIKLPGPSNDTGCKNAPEEPPKPPLIKWIDTNNLKPPKWIIKGVLEDNAIAMLYGDSNIGKSFVAIDIACSIAAKQDWNNHKLKRHGAVFYVAGEGESGISRRVKAWQLENQPFDDGNLPIGLIGSMDLSAPEAVSALIEGVNDSGRGASLVVVDTLNANCRGGESDSTDMGAFIAQMRRIRDACNCAVLVVHHSGKNAELGARGSSALRAGMDSEYQMTKTKTGEICFKFTKMRDAEIPEPIYFKLNGVKLGFNDEDGEPVTSAVVTPVETKGVASNENKSKTTAAEVAWSFNDYRLIEFDGKKCPHITREDLRAYYIKHKRYADSTAERHTRPSAITDFFGDEIVPWWGDEEGYIFTGTLGDVMKLALKK